MAKMNWSGPAHNRNLSAPATPKVRKIQRSASFKAKHPGWCRNCHREFRVGTLLRYNSANKIVHANACPSKKASGG